VGLIDMAYVFKNYEKFTALTESLQKEIEQTDGQARGIVEKMKQLQGQLTSGNLQDGSPDSSKIEAELVKSKTELETFKLTAQRDFLRKEADIYKTVYLEVENAVRRYSAYYQYTLVLRFNRQKVDEAENPRDIINGMNRQVVFFRAQDDLTDPILDYLNGEWRKQNGVRPATPAKPAASPGAAPAGKPAAAAPRGGTAR
jgi:outer membrane protein